MSPAMHAIDFELDREFVELNQLLKLAGLVESGAGAIGRSGRLRFRQSPRRLARAAWGLFV